VGEGKGPNIVSFLSNQFKVSVKLGGRIITGWKEGPSGVYNYKKELNSGGGWMELIREL
jgi:hypothetical protein